MHSILDRLEKQSNEFWQHLAKKYFLDATVCEVLMVPDAKLARDIDTLNVNFF